MKNTGITLIVLVITIIVLLILAGVSIATLTGQNGILSKTTNAKEYSIMAEEIEIIKMAYANILTEHKVDGEEISSANLQGKINQFKSAVVEEVTAIPEDGTIIDNGLSSGTIGKITMENVYYIYLNSSMKKFYIELYKDTELVETLTFNFGEDTNFIVNWFDSKYCIGLENVSRSITFPGGYQIVNCSFTYKTKRYSMEVVLDTDEGSTGEGDLKEGKIYKAYQLGE